MALRGRRWKKGWPSRTAPSPAESTRRRALPREARWQTSTRPSSLERQSSFRAATITTNNRPVELVQGPWATAVEFKQATIRHRGQLSQAIKSRICRSKRQVCQILSSRATLRSMPFTSRMRQKPLEGTICRATLLILDSNLSTFKALRKC